MQAIRNGTKSFIRTPAKSALFVLMLAVLAALLSVAVCVFSSVRGYLADCGRFYHTVVQLEYIGANYPETKVFDAACAEAAEENRAEIEALAASDGVIAFEPADPAAVIFDGVSRVDKSIYDYTAAVMRIHVMTLYEDGSYSASVEEAYYSRKPVEGKMMLVLSNQEGLQPETDYLVAGHFYSGKSSYIWFFAEGAESRSPQGVISVPAFTPYVEGADDEALYKRYAAELNARNDSCRVCRTSDLENVIPFNQGEITLKEGRLFTEEEYASSAHAIIISDALASIAETAVGEKVRLQLIETGGDIYSGLGVKGDAYEEYEVVGIYPFSIKYPHLVFMPDSGAASRRLVPVTGYDIGAFRIENSKANAFIERTSALSRKGFRFTLYDQGYSAATEPMRELLLISTAFLAVCAVFTLAALALQGHLFVTRQRESARTMLAMGAGRGHICLYFITAALLAAIPAAVIGAAAGKLLEARVLGMLSEFASRFAAQDLRFSSSRITAVKTLDFTPNVSGSLYALSAAVFIALAAAAALIYTLLNLREKHMKTGKKRRSLSPVPSKAGRSSRISGPLKYSLLSIKRGGIRTAAILLLCIVIAFFFGRLTYSLEGYREQLAAFRRDSVIKGHASDVTGRMIDGLSVSARHARLAAESDVVSGYNFTEKEGNLRFEGVSESASGVNFDLPEIAFPESSFAIETLAGQMGKEPLLIGTSSVSQAPEFYYSPAKSITWLEGYSDESFAEGKAICALSESYMRGNGIELGDTVRFLYCVQSEGSPVFDVIYLKAAAAYVPSNDTGTVLCPLQGGRMKTFGSFTFTLDDTSRLNELREALALAGFRSVGPNERSSNIAVIDDSLFLEMTGSMERQIQYVGALYYSLYALAGAVGAALAWLLTASRRGETALMRALGTPKGRVLANFQFEMMALGGVGLAIGLAITRLALGRAAHMQLILTAAFFALWSVSSLISLLVSLKKQEHALLSEPE